MKKTMKTWKKAVLFVLAQLLFVTAVLMAYNVIQGSQIIVQTRQKTERFQLDFSQERVEFEDSEIYNRLLENTVNDLAILAVVRDQMEAGGNFYGGKQIDITEYVNRRDKDLKEDVTAVYCLEDLLKWYKYGLEYTAIPVRVDNWENAKYAEVKVREETEEVWEGQEENSELAEYNLFLPQSVSANASADAEGHYTPSVWQKQSIDYYTPYAKLEDIYTDEEGRTFGNLYVLKCRYLTVRGEKLEELVNNWQDYFTLVHNLDLAIANLSTNFDLYQDLMELYGPGKSNVKYCTYMTPDRYRKYLSNLPEYDNMNVMPEEPPLTKEFQKKFGQYIYYYPMTMKYETNTTFMESQFFNILTSRQLEYAYPETTKFWVGIDTDYPVQDVFAKAREQYYGSKIPSKWVLIWAGLLALVSIMMQIFLCCKAGWGKNQDGETVLRLNGFDKLHTEFVTLAAILVSLIGYFAWRILLESHMIEMLFYRGYKTGGNLLFGAALLITCLTAGTFFLSLVRRIKGHNLISGMLLVKVYHAMKDRWEESVRLNENTAKRNWAAYLGYLLINFILVAAGLWMMWKAWHNLSGYGYRQIQEGLGVLMILVAIVFDVRLGYRIMRDKNERYHIIESINQIRDGNITHKVSVGEMHGENQVLAEAVNSIGEGIHKAVETSMKDERLKADLITNVSHDIKTPLTSIINYVDLLKRENIENEKVKGYIEVLDAKSQRLKQLTEDLVEASKISSGNISYVFERINLTELVHQAVGEFSEKFEQKGLTLVDNLAGQTAYIEADSRRMWRVIENLFHNIYKYAMENTRVYLLMQQEQIGEEAYVSLSVKNISAQPLNIDASELTERFIRGDVSRSTEGSGLGLSIAKNLTQAQHGKFEIYLDGDLFKVTLTFPLKEE